MYEKLRNKNFEVLEHQKNNTIIHAQGEPILFYAERNSITRFIVTAVSENKYTFQIQTNHIDGKLIAFGKEQIFNSDDTSYKSNRDSLVLFNLINKTSQIEIINNQVQNQDDTASSMIMVIQDDPAKYYLPLLAKQIKLGYSWSDSVIGNNHKSINQYVITKSNADSIEVSVYKEIEKISTLSQDGKLLAQQLKGFASSTRWYNARSQLLQNENSKVTFSGTTTLDNQSLPISITIQTSIRLFPKAGIK